MKLSELRSRYSLASLLVIAIGVVVTGLGSWHEFHLAEQVDQVRFRELAETLRGDIVRRMRTYQYGLQSLRCLYQSSEFVTPSEFDAAARLWNSEKDFPGVLGIGYVESVPTGVETLLSDGEQDALGGSQRDETSTRPHADLPAGPRRFDRMIVRCFHPAEGNEPWLGLSLGNLPAGQLAAEQAAERGEAVLSRQFDLALGGKAPQQVLLSMLPVYNDASLQGTEPLNADEVRGWICIVLNADKVFADISADVHGEVSFGLYDGTDRPENLLFGDAACGHHGISGAKDSPPKAYYQTVPLEVGGREWTIVITTADKFEKAPRDLAWLLIACGCLMTLLVAYILQVQSTALQRARQLADCMTEELRRLAMVAQRTTNGVVITDADRKILWANEGFTRLTGYDIAEVLGLTPGHFLHCPSTDADTLVAIRNAERGVTAFHGEVLHRRKSGEEYWVDLEIQPLLDESGDLYGFIAIQSDITDRVKAERRARSLAGILQESPNEIYLFDTHSLCMVEVNTGACQQLGYTRDEMIGQPAELFNPDFNEEKVRQLVEPLASGSLDKLVFDTKHRRKDGTEYHAHVNLHRSRFEGHDVYVAFVADLTDRLQLEQQLAQSQKLESIGQLAAGVAHEINSPMQCVVTNVEYLSDVCVDLFKVTDAYRNSLNYSAKSWEDRKSELERLEVEFDYEQLRQNTLDAIVESVDAATRVVEVVRAMRTMSHPGSTDKIWVDLNEMVRSAVMVTKSRWKYYASMELALDETLPSIPLLSNQVNQVLLNLLVNAADAIGERLGRANAAELGRIELATWWESGGVMIRIRDTGCGMTEEVKQRAFDPFFTTKEIGRGSGQGLAISYDVVVQKHGGRITIDSEVGEGTTVTVWLPGHSPGAIASECVASEHDSTPSQQVQGLGV